MKMKKYFIIAFLLVAMLSMLTACGKKECSWCNGTGKSDCLVKVGAEVLGSTHGYDCTYCNGTGKVVCPDCKGTGIETEK